MPYCNWCQLESETDDACVWCKRPYSSGPSLFNTSKKSDIHFIRTDDENSDIQLPIFAFLGVMVFVAVVGFARYSLKHNQPGAAGSQNVAQITNQSKTDEADFKLDPVIQQQEFSNSQAPMPRLTRGPVAAPPPQFSDPTRTQLQSRGAYGPEANPVAGGSWRALLTPTEMWPDQDKLGDHFSRSQGPLFYFQTANFKSISVKGKPKLVCEIVLINDGIGTVSNVKLWFRVGGTKLTLVPYDGSIQNPSILSSLTVPAQKSTSVYAYANGFTDGINLSLKKEVGLDGVVSGQPVHISSVLSS